MADEKTTMVVDNTSSLMSLLGPMLSQRGIDPNVLMASCCKDGRGFRGEEFLYLVFLMMMWQNGGGWGNNNHGMSLANQMNDNASRELLMQAIQGNGNSVEQLATKLGCSLADVQGAINSLNTQILNVGNNVGLSSQQIINAILSGNANIANQISTACCNITTSINNQGYENRIANAEQTSILGAKIDGGTALIAGKIDNQTALINDKFCQLEMREMQNKLDAQRAENTNLRGQISNIQQTGIFQQMISTAVAPLQQAVSNIQGRLPETVTVPANNGVLIPPSAAYQMGLYGVAPFNTMANSLW